MVTSLLERCRRSTKRIVVDRRPDDERVDSPDKLRKFVAGIVVAGKTDITGRARPGDAEIRDRHDLGPLVFRLALLCECTLSFLGIGAREHRPSDLELPGQTFFF